MPGPGNALNISEAGYVVFDGTSTFNGRTFQAGTGITLTNASGVAGNTTISTTASLTDLHTAKYIVSSAGTSGTGANYTTITAAIAAAQVTGVPSTIFIMPGTNGTYTENFTLPANVNLVAYSADAMSPSVTISGTITCSDSGSRSISGIRLQTNGASFLTISGSVATVVNLENCFLSPTNATGITYSSSSGNSRLFVDYCRGDLGGNVKIIDQTSAGVCRFNYTTILNTAGATTASTCSAGVLNAFYTLFESPFTFSGTAGFTWEYCGIFTTTLNVTCLTAGGSNGQGVKWCRFHSGTASAISHSQGLIMTDCEIRSTNTNTITGAGTLFLNSVGFTDSSSGVNSTTVSGLVSRYGISRSTNQPCFQVSVTNPILDVTGDGTVYPILFETNVFDQNSNITLNSGGRTIFTAPYTGKYFFSFQCNFNDLAAGMTTGNLYIVTSASGTFFNYMGNVGAARDAAGTFSGTLSYVVSMTAADTVYCQLAVFGGAKAVNVVANTVWSGYLVA